MVNAGEQTMGANSWDDMTRGVGCLFCGERASADEYKIEIAKLAVSTLYLKRDQGYPGFCLLVYDRRHVNGIEYLEPDELPAAMADLHRAARAIRAAVRPDQMNYASLGNGIPHLHWHIIPRFKSERKWGRAHWTTEPGDPERVRSFLSDEEYRGLVERIRTHLS
jgi:diadenosine tetraphosphate (Ap4A) HIT family hydrolase